MKIKDYIESCLSQIENACLDGGHEYPEKVEFLIQINSKGDVCSQGEMAVSSIKTEMPLKGKKNGSDV